jgi:hypothetical protein
VRYTAIALPQRLMPAAAAPSPANGPDSAINFLMAEARLDRTKKSILLSSGKEFVFWSTPLVAAERTRAQEDAKSESTEAYILMLLVQKATYESGEPMFNKGHIRDLETSVREVDLQNIELAMLKTEKELDPKD